MVNDPSPLSTAKEVILSHMITFLNDKVRVVQFSVYMYIWFSVYTQLPEEHDSIDFVYTLLLSKSMCVQDRT